MGQNFFDKRRSKRTPITMQLEISELFKQENVKVNNIDAPIEIKDISRHGIGFVTKSVLPIGFYFNSRLEFENEANNLNCVVRILHQEKMDDGNYHYGCEFVGMATVFDYVFDELEEADSNGKD